MTAKDDQPGPIGRRHSSTGGDAAQSVLIRTPRTTPSRSGPRKPGHSGRLAPAIADAKMRVPSQLFAGTAGSAFVAPEAGAGGATAPAASVATGSFTASAVRRGRLRLGLGPGPGAVPRRRRPPPLEIRNAAQMPSVRTSIHTAQPSRMAATRSRAAGLPTDGGSPPPTRPGRELGRRNGVDVEHLSHHPVRNRDVGEGPRRNDRDDHQGEGRRRSDQGARLKNSHQTSDHQREDEPAENRDQRRLHSEERRPRRDQQGRTNLVNSSTTAATTPGHSRSGFRGVGSESDLSRMISPYSDLSACSTSTRDARAAGISEARIAAPTSTAAAPRIGSAPGSRTFSK